MSLGERIKAYRKRCGLTQEQVAERAGVSRQAVTKWESGQSTPSTENLFKLAELFGTTVDLLLEEEAAPKAPSAQEVYALYAADRAKRADERRQKWKKNLLSALLVAAGYAVVYLLGRALGPKGEPASVLGWLFGTDPQQLSYLYGWLLQRTLFWIAMAVACGLALLGKRWVAWTALGGFVLGLVLGEALGPNLAGVAYGHGHYGWAIWGGVWLFSLGMGAALEALAKKGPLRNTKGLWIWTAAALAGVAGIVALVIAGMPRSFGA